MRAKGGVRSSINTSVLDPTVVSQAIRQSVILPHATGRPRAGSAWFRRPRRQRGAVASSHVAVDVAAMAEADDHDHQDIVLNSIDDSIVADTNTIEIVETGQTLLGARIRALMRLRVD